jgi:tetratricopeptide (TPR) repeat protein
VNAVWLAILLLAGAVPDIEKARDLQDRVALESAVAQTGAEAEKQTGQAEAQYRAALAASYLAEVALELRDRDQARRAAENGIRFAERAVALQPDRSEYQRVLGTLCGQVIPANVLAAFKYGKQAQDAINRALELDPKSPRAYLSRGVGNYYLPAPFGPGLEAAIQDFRKAIELDPRSAEAYLWLGIALRKANRIADARQAFARSLELNPGRVWARQQLEKAPAR